MNVKKSASDILRDKYMASQLKKTADERVHPSLDEITGIDYLKSEIKSKLYSPIFNPEKYKEIGANPPKTLLIHGISGVGKTFIVNCFAQQYQIPLITGFIETPKDIKDMFSRSKTADKSIILIKNVENVLEEKNLAYQLKESVKAMDWCALVIYTNKDIPESIKFDNSIFVKIPTVFGRKDLLDGLIKNIKSDGVDTMAVAQNTPGFVAENLVKLISMAVTRAISRVLNDQSASEALLQVNIKSNSPFVSLPNLSTAKAPVLTMNDIVESIKDWKNIEKPITFDDIGAMDRVKDELAISILLPSRYPTKFFNFGISKPSGILLYGPPGCGKTLIAKAVSNMSHCNFLSIKGPELITKYVGDSEKHLRDLFLKAKNLSPCVLFFDEIDSLCSTRGKNEFGNRIVNQILTLLDGMEDRGEVYLIGATNRIDSIDPALMRPGRFDKIIEVPLPTLEEGREIFKKCVTHIPCRNFDVERLDLEGLSGADISGVVKEAAIMCLKDNFDKEDLFVEQEYFERALEKFKNMKLKTRKRKTNK